jgi:ArsR family transcriptional regulator, lead/cadmium/zinc/bismuth-responsive transcriptional repressor
VNTSDTHCAAEHLDSRATEARRERMISPDAVQALADTFRILGDPTRVRILDALASGELCVCDIAGLVGISESAVSHQLRLLRGMRLVRPRRAGRQVYYSIDDHHIISLFQQGLRHVSETHPSIVAVAARAAAHAEDRP